MVWIRVSVVAMTKIIIIIIIIIFFFLPSLEAGGCAAAHPFVQIGYYNAPTCENKPRKKMPKITPRMS